MNCPTCNGKMYQMFYHDSFLCGNTECGTPSNESSSEPQYAWSYNMYFVRQSGWIEFYPVKEDMWAALSNTKPGFYVQKVKILETNEKGHTRVEYLPEHAQK